MNPPQATTPAAATLAPTALAPVALAPAALFPGQTASGELAMRVLVFGALFAWCALLLIFRMRQAATFAYAFLEWNLFLAAIPAAAAWLLAQAAAKRAPFVIQAFWFVVWLAFLPNAPYVMTDLVHLGHSATVPIWYDLMLLGSCGATGLLLGYTSLADVQSVVTRRYSARLGWAVVGAGLLLSGFGIYLGRFLRLNSWDTFVRPLQLTADIAHLLADPDSSARVMTVTLVYGMGLLLGYIALRALAPSLARAGTA